jgi:hypothetical protein
VLVALSILIVSCGTLRVPPPRNSGQAVLIFPMDYVDDAPGTFFADYEFFAYRTDIPSSLHFIIDIDTKKRFNFYRKLPPTTNEIRKIEAIDRESRDVVSVQRFQDIEFELQGGKYNVLPYMVRVELVRSRIPGEGRKPVQRVYFDRLRDDEYAKVYAALVEGGLDGSLIVRSTIPEREE